ncbi:MAG: chromate transporter [Bacteroidales bacterium]|nr:chromate transporter [Bacteroidales bacterium]
MNTYLQIFTCFSKIGAFTIGGGYAMIPIIQREVVDKKKWIREEDFLDVLAISQSAPGILAVNISIFLGYRLKGVKGSIVATLGSTLPSFIIILAIAMFFAGYQHNPTVIKIFQGIRPAVVALIAAPVINMAKKAKLNIFTGVIAATTMILVAFLKVSPLYILLVTAILFISMTLYNKRKTK